MWCHIKETCYKVMTLKLLLMKEIHPHLMAAADVHTDQNSIIYVMSMQVSYIYNEQKTINPSNAVLADVVSEWQFLHILRPAVAEL